jgi:coproporphyrinogen III oxidase-like Fe-S oxidoreductase
MKFYASKILEKLIHFIFLGVEKVTSIFFGGGTPSLTQPEVIEVKLLKNYIFFLH